MITDFLNRRMGDHGIPDTIQVYVPLKYQCIKECGPKYMYMCPEEPTLSAHPYLPYLIQEMFEVQGAQLCLLYLLHFMCDFVDINTVVVCLLLIVTVSTLQ